MSKVWIGQPDQSLDWKVNEEDFLRSLFSFADSNLADQLIGEK